jgi:hypothetical protein
MTESATLRIHIPVSVRVSASSITPRSATVVRVFHLQRRLKALIDFQTGELSSRSRFYREFVLLSQEEMANQIASLASQVEQFRKSLTRDDLSFVFQKGRRFEKLEIDS